MDNTNKIRRIEKVRGNLLIEFEEEVNGITYIDWITISPDDYKVIKKIMEN